MKRFLFTFILLSSVFYSNAQNRPLYNVSKQDELKKITVEIQQNAEQRQNVLAKLAELNKWPLHRDIGDGKFMILTDVSETGQPIYTAPETNILAAATTRTNALMTSGDLGLNLTGGSPAMKDRLAVWDGGRVLATHSELEGRVIQKDNPSALSAHSTHVSGTMIATGLNAKARGMANEANLQAYDFGTDTPEMSAAAANLLISNHSYGTVSGWVYNSTRPGTNANLKWEWYGDTTINGTEEYKFGLYTSSAREYDRIAFAAPYYLITKSAGNNRGDSGPPAGTPYFLGSGSIISTTPRSRQTDYDLLPTVAVAKNIMTVGAISSLSYGVNTISDARISSFSSWGPTDDGRIKPDIVGMGVSVFSLNSTGNNTYTTLSGTSMSSPNVAGSLFLLQELYQKQNNSFMRSATLKGLAIHTAADAGNAGPDYVYGWGVLDAKKAAEAILNKTLSHSITEKTLNPNETHTTSVIASGKGPLTVTICWTDPEGSTTPSNSANFDSRIPKLVNDLDIRVSDGTTTSLPWILDVENPSKLAAKGDNILDNVEQILIPNPIPGKTYTITVKHKGILTNSKQDYSIIVSGIGGKAYCESKATSNADSKITAVKIGNMVQNGVAGCQSYNDFMAQSLPLTMGQSTPVEVTVGTCGADVAKAVKIFADWNADGDFDDANETIGTSNVLTAAGTYQTTISSPNTGLSIGDFVRLRVVCTETNNAQTVSSCGTYAKGETQDLLLNIVRPMRDLTLQALVSPDNNMCSGQISSVAVKVRNIGASSQTNVPVSVEVFDGNTSLGTITGTTKTIAAFAEGTVTMSGALLNTLQAGKTYTFVSKVSLANDENSNNDVLRESRNIAPQTPAPIAAATLCGTDPLALVSKGNGTAYWYGTQTAAIPTFVGNVVGTTTTQNTFYVALNDFKGSIGPVAKSAFGGGTYAGSFGPAPLVKTETPLLIESARLYIASAGQLTFNVLGLDDRYVSSTTIDVTPSRNANAPNVGAPTGQVADDPNDAGTVYQLNLPIPTAGSYKITIEYAGGASIFRSNVGVTGFPYSIPKMMSIRGALSGVDTLTNAYYYFYDMKVRSLGCPSERVMVTTKTATKGTPTIATEGNALSFCEGSSLKISANDALAAYQWFLDGKAISNATASSFQSKTTGVYTLSASVNNCLPTLSTPITLTAKAPEKPVITTTAYELMSTGISGFKWYFNDVLVNNAATKYLGVYQSGKYTVKANVNGCGELLSDPTSMIINPLDRPKNSDFVMLAFPNPATNVITYQYLSNDATSRNVMAEIYDVAGRLIQQKTMNQTEKFFQIKFNIEKLNSGTFFAIIRDSNTARPLVRQIMKN